MKTIFKVGILFVMGLLISQFAYAEYAEPIIIADTNEAPFSLGKVTYNGNGCPAGSATAVLSPDGNELSVMFSEFTAQTGSTPYAYSNCNIAIPIDLPPGIMVGLMGIDYRGLAMIPRGGFGRLSREYFFAGDSGPKLTNDIKVYDTFYEFLYEDELEVISWTDCGESTILRNNTTAMVMAPPNSPMPAMMSVFSEDWDISVEYHLIWEPCR